MLGVGGGKDEGKGELGSLKSTCTHYCIYNGLPTKAHGTHRELCSMLCDSLDGGGVRGRIDTNIRTAESLCCSPEKITIWLIRYSPI